MAGLFPAIPTREMRLAPEGENDADQVDCAGFGLGAGGVHAAELNCPQVRLITPYPAGGATDVASRLIAERLSRSSSGR